MGGGVETVQIYYLEEDSTVKRYIDCPFNTDNDFKTEITEKD